MEVDKWLLKIMWEDKHARQSKNTLKRKDWKEGMVLINIKYAIQSS